jgi:hypothetical protein
MEDIKNELCGSDNAQYMDEMTLEYLSDIDKIFELVKKYSIFEITDLRKE